MTDKITVITQTTAEREAETKQLYKDCLPYLQKGLTLRLAVQQVKGTSHTSFSRFGWYKELLYYAREQGYNGY